MIQYWFILKKENFLLLLFFMSWKFKKSKKKKNGLRDYYYLLSSISFFFRISFFNLVTHSICLNQFIILFYGIYVTFFFEENRNGVRAPVRYFFLFWNLSYWNSFIELNFLDFNNHTHTTDMCKRILLNSLHSIHVVRIFLILFSSFKFWILNFWFYFSDSF